MHSTENPVLANIDDETDRGVLPTIHAARLKRASDAIRSPAGNGAGTLVARSWHGQGHGGGTVVSPYLSESGTREIEA